MLVMRPGDAGETTEAWRMVLEAKKPAALILSRQNIAKLPVDCYDGVKKGGYIVMKEEGADRPDVILVANGSEVATLVEGAELLKADGVKVRVVSVPSEGLFRDQPTEYQQEVLPAGVKKFGLTSGLPVTLAGLVGADGVVSGLDHFGYSAPYKVLDEKFGFNGQSVYRKVKEFLAGK